MTTRPTLGLRGRRWPGAGIKPASATWRTAKRRWPFCIAPARMRMRFVPDLVILDLNLPKKDGRAVLAEAKADTDLRTIPVVVFSTSRSMLDIDAQLRTGRQLLCQQAGKSE